MAVELNALASIDIADPLLHSEGDAHAAWRWLRENDPVRWNVRADGTEYWSVTTYAESVQVLRDSKAFSSRYGIKLGGDPRAVAAAADKMLIVTDPPRQGKIRRVIGSAFTARTVQRLEHNMRRTVTEMLDAALEDETVDFTRVAAKLPVSVICDLLGVPREDWDFMLDRTTVAFGAVDENGVSADAATEAHTDILVYYSDLVARRRREPQDDVISALVQGAVDGKPLTEEEIFLNCNGLISGGNETTRHASVGGVLAFAADSAQWRRLRSDGQLIETAVGEILRWTSPGTHTLRTATQAITLAGRDIEPGQAVVIWNPSANRDASVFPDADRFLIDRTVNRHLAFGIGAHYCLGSALATTELRILFEELARRVADIEQAGPVRRVRSNHISGYEEAPVRLVRAAD